MKTLYRYEINYSGEAWATQIYISELDIIRETEKNYIIRYRDKLNNKWRDKFISKNENLNKYAYISKENAKIHFKRRLKKRIMWYNYWKKNCEIALDLLEELN